MFHLSRLEGYDLQCHVGSSGIIFALDGGDGGVPVDSPFCGGVCFSTKVGVCGPMHVPPITLIDGGGCGPIMAGPIAIALASL
jgi:hypothetical protein